MFEEKVENYCIIQGFARMGFGANRQRGMDGVRKNANEVYDGKFFRKGGNFFRTLVNIFREVVLRKSLFVVCELCRRSLGRLSVFARWNKGRYKRSKRDGNLNKTHFFCFGVLWSFLGSSLVSPWLLTREYQGRHERR